MRLPANGTAAIFGNPLTNAPSMEKMSASQTDHLILLQLLQAHCTIILIVENIKRPFQSIFNFLLLVLTAVIYIPYYGIYHGWIASLPLLDYFPPLFNAQFSAGLTPKFAEANKHQHHQYRKEQDLLCCSINHLIDFCQPADLTVITGAAGSKICSTANSSTLPYKVLRSTDCWTCGAHFLICYSVLLGSVVQVLGEVYSQHCETKADDS